MDEGIALILDGISIIYNPLVENSQTLALLMIPLPTKYVKPVLKTSFKIWVSTKRFSLISFCITMEIIIRA